MLYFNSNGNLSIFGRADDGRKNALLIIIDNSDLAVVSFMHLFISFDYQKMSIAFIKEIPPVVAGLAGLGFLVALSLVVKVCEIDTFLFFSIPFSLIRSAHNRSFPRLTTLSYVQVKT